MAVTCVGVLVYGRREPPDGVFAWSSEWAVR